MKTNKFSRTYKIFAALLLTSLLSTAAVAEEVNYSNRHKFTKGSNFKNSQQTLCKGKNFVAGLLTSNGTSAQGDWQSFFSLAQQTDSIKQQQKLFNRALKTVNQCINNLLRPRTPLIADSFWWHDTMSNNSTTQDDNLFSFEADAFGEQQMVTYSEETNIHSHYLGLLPKVRANVGVEYTGELSLEDASGGIGITFLSDYPNSDSYYRLRNFNGSDFHLATHPDTEGQRVLTGTTETGVIPQSGLWYRFKIRTFANKTATTILAKIWLATEDEPRAWQIDAQDTSAERYNSGRFGIWSMSNGKKGWRRLSARGVTR